MYVPFFKNKFSKYLVTAKIFMSVHILLPTRQGTVCKAEKHISYSETLNKGLIQEGDELA